MEPIFYNTFFKKNSIKSIFKKNYSKRQLLALKSLYLNLLIRFNKMGIYLKYVLIFKKLNSNWKYNEKNIKYVFQKI